MTRACLVLVACACTAALHAQPAFRSSVDLVTIPVTLSSRDHARHGELGPADFRVLEDGVVQTIAIVSHEPRRLSLCVLLDSSPSMASGRGALASRTIDAVLAALRPDDEASILLFASGVRTLLPWTPVSQLKPISWIQWRLALGTALIDAMREAFRAMEQASNPQPVILVVSDGGENASRTPLARMVTTRRQSEVQVYAVDTEVAASRTAPSVNRAFSDFLPDLVGDTGGTIYHVANPEAADSAAQALVDELRAQYVIGYVPRRPLDGTYRQLVVRATDPRLTVRHRGGYLAQPASSQ
jgi:Ca-activated chloride channel homolog